MWKEIDKKNLVRSCNYRGLVLYAYDPTVQRDEARLIVVHPARRRHHRRLRVPPPRVLLPVAVVALAPPRAPGGTTMTMAVSGRLRQRLAGGRRHGTGRWLGRRGARDAGHDGLHLLVHAVVEGAERVGAPVVGRGGGAAVADAADLDAEAPRVVAAPRVEGILLRRVGGGGGGGGGEWRVRERDGGAAERAGRGGAEPGVDTGGVERVAARREQPQLGLGRERREADGAVGGALGQRRQRRRHGEQRQRRDQPLLLVVDLLPTPRRRLPLMAPPHRRRGGSLPSLDGGRRRRALGRRRRPGQRARSRVRRPREAAEEEVDRHGGEEDEGEERGDDEKRRGEVERRRRRRRRRQWGRNGGGERVAADGRRRGRRQGGHGGEGDGVFKARPCVWSRAFIYGFWGARRWHGERAKSERKYQVISRETSRSRAHTSLETRSEITFRWVNMSSFFSVLSLFICDLSLTLVAFSDLDCSQCHFSVSRCGFWRCRTWVVSVSFFSDY